MDAKFSLGQIGITDYLIVICRKVSDPLAEIGRQVFPPVVPTNQNVVFVGLDPDFYFFDVYESTNGTTLSVLFNTFEVDVASNQILAENRYYIVDRGNVSPIDGSVIDPRDSTINLDDPYLSGKTVTSVIQRGTGPLIPTTEWIRTATGIALVAPLQFSDLDTYIISITYPAGVSPSGSTAPFSVEADITVSTVLDSTYYNKTINCNSIGSQLTIRLGDIGSIPDKTQFLFIDQEGGLQNQTKIVPWAGDFIKWRGVNMSEIWIGKGEWIILKKRGTSWKVVQAHEGLNMIGLRYAAQYKNHVNTHAEDNSLYSADDFPREWWFINQLPANLKIIDDTLDAGGYTRPANKQGQYIISTTKRKYRMPDTHGLYEKGMLDFTNYNIDGTRPFDYPGGYQPDHVGAHDWKVNGVILAKSGNNNRVAVIANINDASLGTTPVTLAANAGESTEVKNIGVIYLRCI